MEVFCVLQQRFLGSGRNDLILTRRGVGVVPGIGAVAEGLLRARVPAIHEVRVVYRYHSQICVDYSK